MTSEQMQALTGASGGASAVDRRVMPPAGGWRTDDPQNAAIDRLLDKSWTKHGINR